MTLVSEPQEGSQDNEDDQPQHSVQGQRIHQQGQKMDADRGQPVLRRTLSERSIVEALAGLRVFAGRRTLDFTSTAQPNSTYAKRQQIFNVYAAL
jgi:hypothetical protein